MWSKDFKLCIKIAKKKYCDVYFPKTKKKLSVKNQLVLWMAVSKKLRQILLTSIEEHFAFVSEKISHTITLRDLQVIVKRNKTDFHQAMRSECSLERFEYFSGF